MTAAAQTTRARGRRRNDASQFVPALRTALRVRAGRLRPVVLRSSAFTPSQHRKRLVLISRWPLLVRHRGARLRVCFLRRCPLRLAHLIGRVGSIAAGGWRPGSAAREGAAAPPSAAASRSGACSAPSPALSSSFAAPHARPCSVRRLAEMDRQFRHPDPDLCDARLGPQHRGRPRRPARSRLCRVLRGRRLFLRAAGQDLRPVVLDLPAARRHRSPRSGASCSAFRCCGCAATISPSSRSPSARSSASF